MAATDEGMAEAAAPILPPPQPPAAPPAARRRSGFWSGLLGGVIAAGAGLAVAHYVPGVLPMTDTAALKSALAAQQDETAALKQQLADLSQRADAAAALDSRLAALESQPAPAPVAPVDLAPLESRLAALDSRLATFESLPLSEAGPSAAAIAQQDAALRQMQAELAALAAKTSAATLSPEAQAQLDAALAAAAAVQAEAEKAQKSIAQTAALGRVQAALESGAPFASALPALAPVPAELTDLANTGIPTLDDLQDQFPSAARAALEAAIAANMGESWTERVGNFLRSQTGVRSLTPRDGTDPDAVLSRAEAALAAGDLTAALAELASLPEPAQAALAPWHTAASQRQAAEQAITALAAGIGQ